MKSDERRPPINYSNSFTLPQMDVTDVPLAPSKVALVKKSERGQNPSPSVHKGTGITGRLSTLQIGPFSPFPRAAFIPGVILFIFGFPSRHSPCRSGGGNLLASSHGD